MTKEHLNLSGKTALVTGAGRGLGRSLAVGLSRAGARVVVADTADFSETLEEISREGASALGLNLDVSRKQAVEAMVARVAGEFGSIDILVNNFPATAQEAGKTQDDEPGRALCTGLKGQFLCAQTAGRQMVRQGWGKILNIAGFFRADAPLSSTALRAGKAGLLLLTKSLAVEWGGHNVQVNAICPGLLAPSIFADMLEKEFLRTMRRVSPLCAYGEPEELVTSAVYLCSGISNPITGRALVIENGWSDCA